jgi:3-hydroxyisobutyrate dehydrogenase
VIEMQPTHNIAVLGVGTMGSAFARRLLGAGMRVSVWDVSSTAAARLAPAGAQVAATPEDAVRDADVVLTMVPTIASIEETMPRALSALPPGATWLQMSTIGVDGTERAMALAQAHRSDVVFVDAPVSGSKTPAEEGKLLILASGPAATLDALAPVFSVLGQKTMRWEHAGSGSRMKLVLNTWLAVLDEGIAEVAVLAQSLDVSLNDVSACIGSTALDAPWALSKLDKIEREAFEPDFSLALAAKDLHLALDAADRAHQRLPMTQSIATQWESALQAGLGDRDVVGAYLALQPTGRARVGEVSRNAEVSPVPVGFHPRRIIPLGSVNGVAAEQQTKGRRIQARDAKDDGRGFRGVAGLLPIVVPLKTGHRADRAIVLGPPIANRRRHTGEVGAEAARLDDRDLDAERPDPSLAPA